MISKELLSEVLGNEVRVVVHWTDKIVQWNEHRNLPHTLEDINIHELAHKCKEWAIDKVSSIGSGYAEGIAWCICEQVNAQFYADTEPEAIFKACEWILKESK